MLTGDPNSRQLNGERFTSEVFFSGKVMIRSILLYALECDWT